MKGTWIRWLLAFQLAGLLAGAQHWASAAQGKKFQSGPARTKLIELYSSEGCSSCPPADERLAALRRDPELWKSIVPVGFHVDYWNRLGWVDPFSRQEFTRRQYQYASEWGVDGVYTPAFIANGENPRGRSGATSSIYLDPSPGVLTAIQAGPDRFAVSYRPGNGGSSWRVYGALLGNGLRTVVRSGENSGRTLKHEFVVLGYASSGMTPVDGEYRANLTLSASGTASPGSYSVAFWVSHEGRQAPVQAAGGDL